jgi:hypothetical protein
VGRDDACVGIRSAKAVSGVVKHLGPSVMSHGSPESVGRPRDESRGVSREQTRYGYTPIVEVAEVGWTHRASCSPGGPQGLAGKRALAGRKLEAPPDAEHEWREGETVRGRRRRSKVGAGSACGFRLAGSRIRRKAFSGFRPHSPHRAVRREVLRLVGQSSVARFVSAKRLRTTQRIGRQGEPIGRARR